MRSKSRRPSTFIIGLACAAGAVATAVFDRTPGGRAAIDDLTAGSLFGRSSMATELDMRTLNELLRERTSEKCRREGRAGHLYCL